MPAAVIELSTIIDPVCHDSPCGENLYSGGVESEFEKLAQAGLGVEKESMIPGEAEKSVGGFAAWNELAKRLGESCRKSADFGGTKHLGMLYYLTLTWSRLEALAGLTAAFDCASELLNRYWDEIHPTDTDSDYEDRQFFLNRLKEAEITSCLDAVVIADSRQYGMVTLGDWLAARREPADLEQIQRSVTQTMREKPLFYDELKASCEALKASCEQLENTIVVRFEKFKLAFTEIKSKVGLLLKFTADPTNTGSDVAEPEALAAQPSGAAAAAAVASGGSDRIASRTDVVNLLSRIILYYARNEPTSPVPAMLERAKRVATMDFREIVQEFNLTGNPALNGVLGWKDEDSSPNQPQ